MKIACGKRSTATCAASLLVLLTADGWTDRTGPGTGTGAGRRSIQEGRLPPRCHPDGGPIDGAADRLQHHPDRDHQSGGGGCRRGGAARDPDRRQDAGHDQPDRLGRRAARAVRSRRRAAGRRRCSSSCRRCFPVKTSRSASTRTRRFSPATSRARTSCCARPRSPRRPRTKRSVINMLQVPGGSESQQVLLQVRFAEVNRRVLQELGVSLFASGPGAVLAAARRPSSSRRRTFERRDEMCATGELMFSDFLNLFFFDRRDGIGGVIKALREPRRVSEPRGAEPDCLQRPGSELPRRRRISGAGRAGRDRAASRSVQGIRHPADVQADDRRRRDPVEGRARSERARLRQRRQPRRLPDSGADDPARADRRRAARRPVVRDRRAARQYLAGGWGGDSDPEQDSDHRLLCSRARPSAPSRRS